MLQILNLYNTLKCFCEYGQYWKILFEFVKNLTLQIQMQRAFFEFLLYFSR